MQLQHFIHAISKVDAELLNQQKTEVTRMIGLKKMTEKQTDALEGVLNLLDVITNFLEDGNPLVPPVKVENMRLSSSGKKAENQFIITTPFGEFFQSYNTVIAFRDNYGNITLDKYYDYSNTTGRYRNEFLMEQLKETRKKVESGEYKTANLNI